MNNLVPLATAKARLGIGRKALLALVRGGRLPALKVGQEWRFDPADIDTFIAEEKARVTTRTPRVQMPTPGIRRRAAAETDWKGADRYLATR